MCNCKKCKKEDISKIIIVMKDDEIIEWEQDDWNDYEYDKKCFIIKKDGVYLGIYNIDCIKYIKVYYA